MIRRLVALALAGVAVGGIAACAPHDARPVSAAAVSPEASLDARAAAIVARMSTERKVAQLVMPDISTITADDVRQFRFGTILNGGNSGPGGNDLAPAADWLALADAMWAASVEPLPGDEPAIPLLWGTDAVHGHSNIPGATLFPHNIGLGATGDAALAERIGEATAAEIAVTGIDWTFAPTLAVATDDRWGRTYESFSEDPALVARLGAATIEGLQGRPGTPAFLDQAHVIATAKHFVGDGGTGGKDRGDTRADPAELKRVHAAPYPAAIAAGVETVMASFSSVNGSKMHGNGALLNGLLRGELGFKGLVVGDWNGHGELPGCTNTDCPQSLLAGVDVYMVPEDWRGLYATLLRQVQDGTIPMARLDEAATRVIRVKLAYGLFEKPRPAQRLLAGRWDLLGSPDHRALAREAVRKSLVLLKNEGGVLPLRPGARVLVAGRAADNIAHQSGGWSLTWQGGGALTNRDFPGATSIYGGIAAALAEGGGQAILSPGGSFAERPDVAVVVFGEEPYAEFTGDREDRVLRDEEGLELLRRLRAQGIPVVAVLLSGRTLWINRELEQADAFVAAWLPGSEGGGIADVLVGDPGGRPRHDFSGRLPFTWPMGCTAGAGVLFPFGTGGSYAKPLPKPVADQACALLDADATSGLRLFGRGLAPTVRATAGYGDSFVPLANLAGSFAGAAFRAEPFDRVAQEDARRLIWTAPSALRLGWGSARLPANPVLSLSVRVENSPRHDLVLTAADGSGQPVSLRSSLELAAGKGWRRISVPLGCVSSGALNGVALSAGGPLQFDIDAVKVVAGSGPASCNAPF
jgi:beta-glucosidase